MTATEHRLDFVLLGAQKCATTWLYECMREHPELCLQSRKREIEYIGGDLYEEKGADWFFTNFAPTDGQKVGAASVDYIFDARSPAAIRKVAPSARLMVSLREPVDRAVSAFFWHQRKGNFGDRQLEDVLAEGVRAPETLAGDLIQRGLYARQLREYLEHYRPEEILVLFFETVQQEPRMTLERVFDFLGVDPEFKPWNIGVKPKFNSHFAPLLALQKLAPKSKLMGRFTDISHQVLGKMGIKGEKPRLSAACRQDLTRHFEPHNRELLEVLRAWPKERLVGPIPAWITG